MRPFALVMLSVALVLGGCGGSAQHPGADPAGATRLDADPPPAIRPAAHPWSGRLDLVLADGARQRTWRGSRWNRRDVRLRLTVDDAGAWAEHGQAAVAWYTPVEDNPVRVTLVGQDAQHAVLMVEADIAPDRNRHDGSGRWLVILRQQGGTIVGSYQGWFRNHREHRNQGIDRREWLRGQASGLLVSPPDGSLQRPIDLVPPFAASVSLPGPAAIGVEPGPPAQGLSAVVHIDGPADTAVDAAAALRWNDGRRYATIPIGPLGPGRWRLDFDLSRAVGEGGAMAGRHERHRAEGVDLILSPRNHPSVAVVESCQIIADQPPQTPPQLVDLDPGPASAQCGNRTQMAFRLLPEPANPYDPQQVRIDLVVIRPDGVEERIPAFYHQPLRMEDRGDDERGRPSGPATWQIRYRPRIPGPHRRILMATFANEDERQWELPLLSVGGPAIDPMVRRHPDDPRFLMRNGVSWWPVGLNLHSVYDVRGSERIGTTLTPNRIWSAYDARLQRAATAGVDAVEIWMAPWNLALEWRSDWPGQHGLAGFNQTNAAILDLILDRAEELDIAVLLVLRNHMQGKEGFDFASNPWNSERGGPLEKPADLFTHPAAAAGDERRRRYLIGRYADHPALLGWKLWSEVNLTSSKQGQRQEWHARASAAWRAADPYDHLITTHWSGNYRSVNRSILDLPAIDIMACNAYHDPGKSLVDMLWASSTDRQRGSHSLELPLLVTEFGGSWRAEDADLLLRDLRYAPWVALVAGHAGTPLFWWNELVDEFAAYGPLRAVARFRSGEDLAGTDRTAVRLQAQDPSGGERWAAAWFRPGRMLGYVVDEHWATHGGHEPALTGTIIGIGDAVAAGSMGLEWWDADRGTVIDQQIIDHPGGALELTVPEVAAPQVAFKLWRR